MIILQDSKEKTPWNFRIYNDVVEQRIVHLETGDYTLLGKETSFVIERKGSTGEISMNLGVKAKQFEAELDRMLTFSNKYVICEFPAHLLLEFPKFSGIPKYKWKYLRINGKFLYKRLFEWTESREIKLFFANDALHAQEIAKGILDEYR